MSQKIFHVFIETYRGDPQPTPEQVKQWITANMGYGDFEVVVE